MANKRMFDKAIIDTDKFMDMPLSSKAIYFLLGMEADDEGFVSYKKVMRIHGGNEDDIKVLLAKNLIIMFESKVVVITDWQKNNWLDTRRIKPTEYQIEKELLTVNKDNSYSLSKCLANAKRVEKRIEENRTVKKSIVNTPSQIFKKFLSSSNQERNIFLKEKLNRCLDVVEEEEVERFVDYWTEPNKSGTKQRWELEKTFDLIRRVKTWFNNIKKFNKEEISGHFNN